MTKIKGARTGWWLALVVALGVVLRLYHLTDRSIWFDEAFTWRMIQFPFGEMLRRSTLDNCPPLYYVLLKCWVACFGDSLIGALLDECFDGCGEHRRDVPVRARPCARPCARPWRGRARGRARGRGAAVRAAEHDGEQAGAVEDRGLGAALFAAALVAVSAFQIRWSWDARPYALGAALAILSSWALFGTLAAREHDRRWWCAYAALAVMLLFTHNFAVFTVAAQAGFVLYILLRRRGEGAAAFSPASRARPR